MHKKHSDNNYIIQQLTAMLVPTINPEVSVALNSDRIVCKLAFTCLKFGERLYCTRSVLLSDAKTSDEVINLVFKVWEHALTQYFNNRGICYETHNGTKHSTNPTHSPRGDWNL